MAKVPGIVPDPQPEQPPENPDHYLPDAEWGQVLRDAARIRREADESETE
jgi:hypothetical protein